MKDEHYMLRQAQFVRNACVHSSNLINGFGIKSDAIETSATIGKALAETGLSHRVRTTKMKNPRLKQIANLMYLHSRIAPERSGGRRAKDDMAALKTRMDEAFRLSQQKRTTYQLNKSPNLGKIRYSPFASR